MSSESSELPEGFRLCQRQQGFSGYIGPFYYCESTVGVRVSDRHCNPEGYLHGGMLSATADFAMYQLLGMELAPGLKTPTVSMTVNYLGTAKKGGWLEANAAVTKTTRSLAFCAVQIEVSGRLVATATAVYKLSAR